LAHPSRRLVESRRFGFLSPLPERHKRRTRGRRARRRLLRAAQSCRAPSLGFPTEPQLTKSTPPYSLTHGLCVWPKRRMSHSASWAIRSSFGVSA